MRCPQPGGECQPSAGEEQSDEHHLKDLLQPEHISPGAVVVGGGVRYEGRRLLPDVDEACEEVAGAITPRVGGVGPTTIAMLFRNAIEAAERNAQRRAQSGTA